MEDIVSAGVKPSNGLRDGCKLYDPLIYEKLERACQVKNVL